MSRSPITTHVLDLALGRPAAGVPVALARMHSDEATPLASACTDEDGRCTALLAPGALPEGTYRLRFELDAYFAGGGRESFYPYAEVVFRVMAGREHYHVPLLLSPFGFSTYRGS